MTWQTFNYATPSVFESTRDRALLGLAADQARPVRFHARVARNVLSLRVALQALGQLVWSDDGWLSAGERQRILDPIITVHPDRVLFEAFSGDQSAYGAVSVERSIFEPVGEGGDRGDGGEVQHGTTNVDFTAWLWAALGEMRSSRETFFRVGPEGLEVTTAERGGRFEQKVDVPDDWVRGFLQLQGAMALPGTRLSVHPVDLLAVIRFLRYTKAKISPRALRYEFEPGQDVALVLEPWEERIRLVGADHAHADRRVVRTWGRRRLRLLEPLLPFAAKVEVHLRGRAMPSFYTVELPGITFVLGLSGWTSQRWSSSGSFDLLVAPERSPSARARVLELLRRDFTLDAAAAARELGLELPAVSRALMGVCAEGRCIYDLGARRFRHRELFGHPVEVEKLYPPDPRRAAAEAFRLRDQVHVRSALPRETRKLKRLKTPEGPTLRELIFRDWVVEGAVAEQAAVEIVLSDEERLIFGRCGCPFFREHLLTRGPCEHQLALLHAAAGTLQDGASSAPGTPLDAEAGTDGDKERSGLGGLADEH